MRVDREDWIRMKSVLNIFFKKFKTWDRVGTCFLGKELIMKVTGCKTCHKTGVLQMLGSVLK